MKTLSWITCALVTLLAASMPTQARATLADGEPIPTMLVATEDPEEYPDPICSKCTIIVVEDETSAGTRATMSIAYPVDAPAYTVDIELTVLIDDGTRRSLWLEDVQLDPGEDAELVLKASSSWSWGQARFVWLRFWDGTSSVG